MLGLRLFLKLRGMTGAAGRRADVVGFLPARGRTERYHTGEDNRCPPRVWSHDYALKIVQESVYKRTAGRSDAEAAE